MRGSTRSETRTTIFVRNGGLRKREDLVMQRHYFAGLESQPSLRQGGKVNRGKRRPEGELNSARPHDQRTNKTIEEQGNQLKKPLRNYRKNGERGGRKEKKKKPPPKTPPPHPQTNTPTPKKPKKTTEKLRGHYDQSQSQKEPTELLRWRAWGRKPYHRETITSKSDRL